MSGNGTGPRVVVLAAGDDVATALEDLPAGAVVEAGGMSVTVAEPVAAGHKVALRDLAAGAEVRKYGETIGVTTRPIEAGRHVHVHNLASRRGRGDREASS